MFSNRSNLRRHEALHQNKTSFRCKQCPVECSRVADLNRHYARRHGAPWSPRPRLDARRSRSLHRNQVTPARKEGVARARTVGASRLNFSRRGAATPRVRAPDAGKTTTLFRPTTAVGKTATAVRPTAAVKTVTVVKAATPAGAASQAGAASPRELGPMPSPTPAGAACSSVDMGASGGSADFLQVDAGDTRLSSPPMVRLTTPPPRLSTTSSARPQPQSAGKGIRLSDTPPQQNRSSSSGSSCSSSSSAVSDRTPQATATATRALREQVDPALLDPAMTGGRRLREIVVAEIFHAEQLTNRNIVYKFFEC
jgi:hypothetical protein